MKTKEYRWSAVIEAEKYDILCTVTNNRYEIRVDEEELTTVYRKNYQDVNDWIEEPVFIGGKLCRFVVVNGAPDIAVDGMLTRNAMSCDEARKTQDRKTRIMALTQIVIALLAIALFIVMAFLGQDVRKWGFSLGFGLFILITGVMQLRSTKR